MISKITTGIARGLMTLAEGVRRTSIQHHIHLEMPVDEHCFVTKTGALVTGFEVGGMGGLPIGKASEDVYQELVTILSILLKDNSHYLTWTFERDKSRVTEDIDFAVQKDRQSAARVGLKVDDIFDEIKEINAKYATYQRSYIVLTSRTTILDERTLKKRLEANSALESELGMNLGDGPDPFSYIPELLSKHQNKVNTLLEGLNEVSLMIKKMTCDELLSVMANQLDPVVNKPGRQFVKAYDRATFKKGGQDYQAPVFKKPYSDAVNETLADFTPDKLARQLLSQNAYPEEDGILRIGSTYHSPIMLQTAMQDDVVFRDLLSEIDDDTPFRVNFIFSDAKDTLYDIKKILVALTGWGHPNNKAFKRATALRAERENLPEGAREVYCGMQVVFDTWGTSIDEVVTRREHLLTCIQKWEGAKGEVDSGDTFETFIATVTGATTSAPCTKHFPPIKAAVQLLPYAMTGQIDREGILLTRTAIDNVLTPIEVMSAEQDYHLDVMLAKPRQGKSVLSNAIALAICCKAGNRSLPYIFFGDVGPTSTGAGYLIRDSLPEHMKDQVAIYKLEPNNDDYINVLHIQYGLNKPLPEERAYIINFLKSVCTDPDTGFIPTNSTGLMNTLITEMFDKISDIRTAKTYIKRVSSVIDDAISSHQIEIDDLTTFIELRDIFFDLGEIDASMAAHTLAMPTLPECGSILTTSDQIARDYGGLKAGEGQEISIIDYISLKIKEACNEYELFNRPSTVNFDKARIIILDTKSVVGGKDAKGRYETGLFLMVARYIGCKNMFLKSETHVEMWPERYREFQLERIRGIEASPKRSIWDEYHTSKTCEAFRDQISFDIKEGPKWNMSLCVLSHEPEDFGPALSMATNLFILGNIPNKQIKYLQEEIGLSPEEVTILKNNKLHGPRDGGSSFLLRTERRGEGMVTQCLKFPKGPKELWSYTTEKTDMPYRQRILSELGTVEARELLSTLFPSGTASKWFKAKKSVLSKDITDVSSEEELEDNLVEELTKESLKRYARNMIN